MTKPCLAIIFLKNLDEQSVFPAVCSAWFEANKVSESIPRVGKDNCASWYYAIPG